MTQAARKKYAMHKSSAKQRGIPFRLTFEEWWALWQASGRWDERGRLGRQYCMARRSDQGGFEAGNVFICPTGRTALGGLPGDVVTVSDVCANRGNARARRPVRKE